MERIPSQAQGQCLVAIISEEKMKCVFQREQRNALNTVINKFKFNENMIELELLSGGNIRFEEIKVDSDQGQDSLESIERLTGYYLIEIQIQAKMIILIYAKSLFKTTAQRQGKLLLGWKLFK